MTDESPTRVTIVDLNYFSLYVSQYDEAVAFYARVFGPPGYVEGDGDIHGWRMGATWLTLFRAKEGPAGSDVNPRNSEFAIQVSTPGDVDRLFGELLGAGARELRRPSDTRMYVPMRFACVDDPFGVRLDIYCPIDET